MHSSVREPRAGSGRPKNEWRREPLLLLDRQPLWPDVDTHALGLFAVLVDLIAEQSNDDYECANDKVEKVVRVTCDLLRGAGSIRKGRLGVRTSGFHAPFCVTHSGRTSWRLLSVMYMTDRKLPPGQGAQIAPGRLPLADYQATQCQLFHSSGRGHSIQRPRLSLHRRSRLRGKPSGSRGVLLPQMDRPLRREKFWQNALSKAPKPVSGIRRDWLVMRFLI
jgi:hypothetical protein